MLELKPIKESTEDYDKIMLFIIELFKKNIYLPLLAEIGIKTLQNSTDDLLKAIMYGRIYFHRGYFKGRFNAAVSRELKRLGAKWDRTQGAWKIPQSSLSIELKNAIATSEMRFSRTVQKIDKKLSEMLPEDIADKLKIEHLFDSTLYKVDREFKKSIQKITIAPTFTPEARAKIAKEYTQNMKLYIQDWTSKEIVSLRKEIQEHTLSGSRYEGMIKTIQKSYDVSQNKAKFLARQETSLLMTKFKETRYLDAGVDQYKWRCVMGSPRHPVRPMHKIHDGKIFSWKNPPIVDSNGDRKNPGQDYNCRCTAVPVVRGF